MGEVETEGKPGGMGVGSMDGMVVGVTSSRTMMRMWNLQERGTFSSMVMIALNDKSAPMR